MFVSRRLAVVTLALAAASPALSARPESPSASSNLAVWGPTGTSFALYLAAPDSMRPVGAPLAAGILDGSGAALLELPSASEQARAAARTLVLVAIDGDAVDVRRIDLEQDLGDLMVLLGSARRRGVPVPLPEPLRIVAQDDRAMPVPLPEPLRIVAQDDRRAVPVPLPEPIRIVPEDDRRAVPVPLPEPIRIVPEDDRRAVPVPLPQLIDLRGERSARPR